MRPRALAGHPGGSLSERDRVEEDGATVARFRCALREHSVGVRLQTDDLGEHGALCGNFRSKR